VTRAVAGEIGRGGPRGEGAEGDFFGADSRRLLYGCYFQYLQAQQSLFVG
jgi:hypothetical protein